MSTQPIRPGRIWYLVPVLIAGAGLFGVLGWAIWSEVTDKRTIALQFKAPGAKELEIVTPGHYTLFQETETTFEGKVYSTASDLPAGTSYELVELGNNSSIPVMTNGQFSFTVTQSSFSGASTSSAGRSVGNFEVVRPGKYRISVAGQFPDQIFLFRESFQQTFLKVAKRILHGLALTLAVFAIALAAAVVIFLRRRAARYAT